MRRHFFLTALAGISLAAVFTGDAVAGGWGSGCGYCGHGYFPASQIYYAPPTYSYARPTITVIPHYVVQPNYIVQRTYVIRQNHYINESAPCLITCDLGRLFNPGRYHRESAFVAHPAGYGSYAPGFYPRRYHTHYVSPSRRHYERRNYRRYSNIYPRGRRYGTSSHRVNSHSFRRTDYRTHYR